MTWPQWVFTMFGCQIAINILLVIQIVRRRRRLDRLS